MKVITYHTKKGGTGKSVLSSHHAWYLVDKGHSVLFIDLDSQKNSSKTLCDTNDNPEMSKWRASFSLPANALFQKSFSDKGLGHGAFDLIGRADAITGELGAALPAFKNALAKLGAHYDYCIIDTPPSFSVESAAALAATDYLIAPLELSQYGIDSIYSLTTAIDEINKLRSTKIDFLGLLVSRFDNKPSQKEILAYVLSEPELSQHLIRGHTRLRQGYSDAMSEGFPVWCGRKTAEQDAGREIRAIFDTLHERMTNA